MPMLSEAKGTRAETGEETNRNTNLKFKVLRLITLQKGIIVINPRGLAQGT